MCGRGKESASVPVKVEVNAVARMDMEDKEVLPARHAG